MLNGSLKEAGLFYFILALKPDARHNVVMEKNVQNRLSQPVKSQLRKMQTDMCHLQLGSYFASGIIWPIGPKIREPKQMCRLFKMSSVEQML